MKKIAVLLISTLVSVSAFAGNPEDDFQIEFISWCEQEKVMHYNDKGDVEVRFDCAEYGQSCKTYSFTRWYRTTYVAACEKKN